jgi:GTPase SAR1 family protein
MESEQELLLKIKQEFDNSAGTLALSIQEFSAFFHLNESTTKRIVEKLVKTEYYELIMDFNEKKGKEIQRIHINPIYARNYWVKGELIEKEVDVLLEIGKNLKTPLNSGIKQIFTKDRHLVKLDLRDQQLANLPETINVFSHLRELRLQNNKLTQLPETIGNLKRLKILDLDHNSLKYLPESIGDLKALEELWIRDNQLEDLPESLKNLKKLQFCSLQGNNTIPESKLPKISRRVKPDKRRTIKPASRKTQRGEYLLKICCIGSVTNIKTEFIRRYVENKHVSNNLPTLGVDITTKSIKINKTPLKLIIVDTAGHKYFGKLRPSYYRGTSAVIILFDKGNIKSFQDVPKWIKEFRTHAYNSIPESIKRKYYPRPSQQAHAPEALVGLVTNSEEVTFEEAQALATRLDLDYFECSPKDGKEISKIFELLTKKVIEGDKRYQKKLRLKILDQIRSLVNRPFSNKKNL